MKGYAPSTHSFCLLTVSQSLLHQTAATEHRINVSSSDQRLSSSSSDQRLRLLFIGSTSSSSSDPIAAAHSTHSFNSRVDLIGSNRRCTSHSSRRRTIEQIIGSKAARSRPQPHRRLHPSFGHPVSSSDHNNMTTKPSPPLVFGDARDDLNASAANKVTQPSYPSI